jgi:hypothetical protein
MKTILKLFLSIVLFSAPIFSNAQCKVQVKELKAEYTGDCKKGKAHGQGEAKGTDSYKGEFSKGYPNGEGTYTWANGNVFIGTFKKGKKSGKGKLVVKETGEEVVGYWKNDEYIGKSKTPYKINQKPASAATVSFRRSGGDKDEIIVEYYKGGKILRDRKLKVTPLEGNYSNLVSNSTINQLQQVTYPFAGMIDVDGQNLNFIITQSGSWKIKINLR